LFRYWANGQADIALNPFLSPHLDDILRLLNTRAIVQYIQPFSSVSLPAMSSSIRIQEDQLLNEIESLLGKGEITGKIDLIDKASQHDMLESRNLS
jgi:COP9 signalosome complex subunit 1